MTLENTLIRQSVCVRMTPKNRMEYLQSEHASPSSMPKLLLRQRVPNTQRVAFHSARINAIFHISSTQLTFSLFVASWGGKVIPVGSRHSDDPSRRIDRVIRDIRPSPDSRGRISPSFSMYFPSNCARNPISEMGSIQWNPWTGLESHSNETSLRPSGERAELPRPEYAISYRIALASLRREAHIKAV